MDTRKTLRMGAMERWGQVRIGVMSAADEPGAENARLRVMSSAGSSTVRVLLGQSELVDGAGTVTLHALDLHHAAEGDDPDVTGRGSVEVSFDEVTEAEPEGDAR